MTISQSRAIIGETAIEYTDKDLQSIIDCFNGIIEVGMQQFDNNAEETFDTQNSVTDNKL
jgi:hypothetical protein